MWVIREQVGLTGTNYGCGIAQCGACSVHINDEVQRSCSTPVWRAAATDRIVTIEGLPPTGPPRAESLGRSIDVPQCGYCQSGQIMAAAALLRRTPKPTDKDIDEAMTECLPMRDLPAHPHGRASRCRRSRPKSSLEGGSS